MGKFIESIYWGFYIIHLYINRLLNIIAFYSVYIIIKPLVNLPCAKKHLAKRKETPNSFLQKQVEALNSSKRSDADGLLWLYFEEALLFFNTFIIFVIILILQLIAGYNFFFEFIKQKPYYIGIILMIVGGMSILCAYFAYDRDNKGTKIIKKYKKKNTKQKRKAMKRFWITVITVFTIFFVLLWYECGIR